MRLGKLPARKDSVLFKLSNYGGDLPKPPTKYGDLSLAVGDNNMFANDRLGDCVCAEAAHGTIHYNKLASKTVSIADDQVVAMYSAVTGYTPSDPNSDQGTDMQAAASYRRKTGLADKSGNYHKILAYLALKNKRDDIKKAIYFFGGAGIGFEFPDYAMDQFNAGKTWHIQSGGTIEGGHDVFAFAYDSRYVHVISWGKVIKMSWGFFEKYCDEAIVYLSGEIIKNGKSPEGFSVKQLTDDLAKL